MGARCDSLNVWSGAGWGVWRVIKANKTWGFCVGRRELGDTVQACLWKVGKERRAASRGAGRYRKRIDQERYWSWEGGDSGDEN